MSGAIQSNPPKNIAATYLRNFRKKLQDSDKEQIRIPAKIEQNKTCLKTPPSKNKSDYAEKMDWESFPDSSIFKEVCFNVYFKSQFKGALRSRQNNPFLSTFSSRSGLGKLNAVIIDFFDYYSCAIGFKKNKISKTFLMVLRG